MQAGCGLVGLEGPHETTKTLGEFVYRLKFEPGTSYLPKKSETLPLSKFVPALNVMSAKPRR